jgi:flagellar biosynthesis chaperone FliJ
MSKYPLEQLVIIKQRKLDEAERLLKEKKEILQKEEEKLTTLETERDKTKAHKIAKLTQLREELDRGSTSDKIQQMKQYLKIVDEQLYQKELRVTEQKKKVIEAQKQVDIARQNLVKRQHDVEKLNIHRKEWEAENRLALEREEAVEVDETGTVRHIRRQQKRKKGNG